jgi:NAD(P)-dependent dehydrogenase (short-subunit alcohol dehydrogenase family)
MPTKYALVTGAGSGIGRAASIALLNNGYRVALMGRTISTLQETAAKSNDPETALVISGDITNPSDVKRCFDKISQSFGRLDLLFNNAGTNTGGLLEDVTYEQWRSVIDTNLSGAFFCTQEAFKLMKKQSPQGGRIINNGSISATVPRPDSAPYTCSKHAMTGLTRSTSLDGRKYNIACSQIDIGNVETPMAHKMKSGVKQADGSLSVEPTFEVQHVCDAILYIAGLPLEANVQFMTVMASKMPFIGRG